MEKRRIKITLEDYHDRCSEPSCCDFWGTDITIDGVKLEGSGDSNYSALMNVLQHLGYEVEIEQIDRQ